MMDEILSALANWQRRQILFALYKRQSPLDMATFTDKTIIYRQDLEEQQVKLIHHHLPMLEEFEFIQWDREEEIVEPGPQFHELQPFLDVLEDYEEFSETGL